MYLVGPTCFRLVLVWQCVFFPVVSSASFRFADNFQQDQTLLADVAPPNPAGPSGIDIWSRSDYLISTFWKDGDGFVSSFRYEDEDGDDSGNDTDNFQSSYTYGEVTTMGVRQLTHALFYDNCKSNCENAQTTTTTTFPENHGTYVFYDLGSGVGRLVAQMYLDRVVQKAIGVELSKERHQVAVDDWRRLTSSLVDGGDDYFNIDQQAVQFRNKDATDVDLSDATHVYISSLCFPESVINIIQSNVLDVASSDTSKISVVAALSELGALEQAGWVRTVKHIQMTWGAGLVRIYNRPT